VAFHGNLIFIGATEIQRELLASSAFGTMIQVKRIFDPQGLRRRYLAKEITPQGGYGRERALGGRLRGSHGLPGGGDRVRLSEELERDAIGAGYVQPWRHTNARRSDSRKPYRPRLLTRRAPRVVGQMALLPELERPVSRLRDFGGGLVPRAVAVELEFRRRQRGWSQRQLGEKIGRSQGQYANAIRGHDPISGPVVNRLRELLLAV